MRVERYFVGSRIQRGHGVSGFFARLLRGAMPLLKRGGTYIGKKAVKAGIETLHDIASGEDAKLSLKRRLADASDDMLNAVKRKIRKKMTGQGLKRRKRSRSVKVKAKKVKKQSRTITKKKKTKKRKRKNSSGHDTCLLY